MLMCPGHLFFFRTDQILVKVVEIPPREDMVTENLAMGIDMDFDSPESRFKYSR